eukprot:scaffold104946_cov67-Phaeocystis_antarctica.AAC.4
MNCATCAVGPRAAIGPGQSRSSSQLGALQIPCVLRRWASCTVPRLQSLVLDKGCTSPNKFGLRSEPKGGHTNGAHNFLLPSTGARARARGGENYAGNDVRFAKS